MQEALYIDLIAKYLSGNIEPPEQEKLLAWVAESPANQAYFDEIIQLWSASGEYEDAFTPPNESKIENAWQAVEQKRSRPAPTTNIRYLSFGKVLLRAAAAILLLVTVAYWLWKPGNEADAFVAISTGASERKEITLPDGSTVWMNESSRLEYPRDFKKRQVVLDGEAFFDVRKVNGQTFTIRSGEALTTVLGTSFNVRAYPEEGGVEVTVKTGKVELKAAEATENRVLLSPGDAGVFEKSRKQVVKIEKRNDNSDAWKTRSMTFDDAPVSEVIQVLERYFEVDIEVSNEAILKCQFKMNMRQNPKLDGILELMDFTMNLKAVRQKDKYILNGDGC
ncbi:MAG: FecR domain-containing protein [Saprospiraceae bacterium]|nr:FecR domain-containing protein [Saprospiraceae bacterium]MDZ4703239.1 FecR domain-containing protein [Saprospiraceae bacterium]